MTRQVADPKDNPGRDALRRWAGPARRAMHFGLFLQLTGIGGWIAIAFGVAALVGGAASGHSAYHGLLIALLGAFARAVSGWFAEDKLSQAGRLMVAQARAEILSRVAERGPAWLSGDSHGARTSQIIDRTAQLHGHAARWQPGVRLSVAGPVLVLAAIATQSWLAAALLLVSVLVLPVFIWLTASGTAAQARAQQSALDHLSGDFQSRAAQSGLIRSFRAVGRQGDEIAARSQALRERTMAILRVAFLSTAVLEFFTSVSIALVAVYVGFKLLGIFPFATGETLTLSEGLAALLLAPEFFAPIRRLSSLHHDRADAGAAAGFLAGWLSCRPSQATRRARLEQAPLIVFEEACLDWPDGTIGIEALSFTARPGEITALTGPSGSGKSTVLLALLGHVRPLAGRICVDGDCFQGAESLADSAAYIGQAPWLMEGTIADNISIASPGASREAVARAAKTVGLTPDAGRETDALARRLGRFGAGLSGGQRQRVALARALLRQAPLLLLDEPAAHLDAVAKGEFTALIREIAPGRTVLLATHSPALKAAADACIVLTAKAPEIANA